MRNKQSKLITSLTILLGASLAVVSFYGGFVPWVYERETASMAAQGKGQDIVDLFLVVPLLIVSLIFLLRKSRIAIFIFSGTILYILYSFFIYSFGVHFNNLFLLYCLTLGLSLYTFILIMSEFTKKDVENWFSDGVPVRSTGVYFILVAVLFYMLWFKDVLPAIVNDSVPKSVSDYDLLVNPVHVLDMAVMLPALIIAAALLMRRRRLGFILAPVLLVFLIILATALVGMLIMLKANGISEEASVAGIFVVLAVVSGSFLFLFLKKVKSVS